MYHSLMCWRRHPSSSSLASALEANDLAYASCHTRAEFWHATKSKTTYLAFLLLIVSAAVIGTAMKLGVFFSTNTSTGIQRIVIASTCTLLISSVCVYHPMAGSAGHTWCCSAGLVPARLRSRHSIHWRILHRAHLICRAHLGSLHNLLVSGMLPWWSLLCLWPNGCLLSSG